MNGPVWCPYCKSYLGILMPEFGVTGTAFPHAPACPILQALEEDDDG